MRIDPSGQCGPMRGQARGRKWRTTTRGLVVPSAVVVTSQQRTLEASAVLKEDEAVTGWAALDWLGARWFDGTCDGVELRDVPLVARRHLLAQPGFSVSQEFLDPTEILTVDDLPVTPAVRSVVFEMRRADSLGDAVVALDMACYSDLVSIAEVAAYVAQLGAVTGIQQARDALVEADENSWSPRETQMRGVWTRRAGLARPLCNAPVFTTDGRHVATPDLVDPHSGCSGSTTGATTSRWSGHRTIATRRRRTATSGSRRSPCLPPTGAISTDSPSACDKQPGVRVNITGCGRGR